MPSLTYCAVKSSVHWMGSRITWELFQSKGCVPSPTYELRGLLHVHTWTILLLRTDKRVALLSRSLNKLTCVVKVSVVSTAISRICYQILLGSLQYEIFGHVTRSMRVYWFLHRLSKLELNSVLNITLIFNWKFFCNEFHKMICCCKVVYRQWKYFGVKK